MISFGKFTLLTFFLIPSCINSLHSSARIFSPASKLFSPLYNFSHPVFRTLNKSLLVDKNYFKHTFCQPDKLFNVRVLLDQKKNSAPLEPWILQSKNGFIITDLGNPHKKTVISSSLSLLFSSNNELYCNGKLVPSGHIKITSIDDVIEYDNKHYHGNFLIIVDANSCYCINHLDLEQYIYCVLKAESWPGWPLEVNKAFAIACRSYLVSKILENKKNVFHIRNTNKHQTYNGTHASTRLLEAVEQTQGIIVTYNKKPIVAMFDSCCGGIIPAHIEGVDFKSAPYLARANPCTFCNASKLYTWKHECSSEDFLRILQESGYKMQNIRSVEIIKCDKAGMVQEIKIHGLKDFIIISGKEIYSLFKQIKSFCYKIIKKGEIISIVGQGYGHHLGLCQWGARAMVEQGWDYKNVLKFYYPGTTLMKLKTVEKRDNNAKL